VFLRYLSAAFARKSSELNETPHADPEDHEEYQADNVFWVPPEARWSTLQGFARPPDVGKRLDDAMRAIERENDELKGVLPKIFGKADFSAQMLGGLIDHFTNLNLTGMADDFGFILANPPFKIKEWGGEFLRDDARWKFGVPPLGNANYAWLQHIYHHLAPAGYAAVILANGSMSSNSGGEGEIRKAMVEGDAVDCMVALPNQLFFGTQIPVCVWIMAKDKRGGKHGERKLRDRRGEVLFLDARKLGYMVNRTQKNLSPNDIAKLTDTYHACASKGARASRPMLSV